MARQVHHYLSQAFLSGFTDDGGNIWMFDRKTNAISASAPKVVAAERDLYTFTDADGAIRRDIETELFRLIDTPIRPILKKLVSRQAVNDAELGEVALFVGYLRVRTPSALDEIEQAYLGLLEKTNPYKSKEYVEERIKAYEKDSGRAMEKTADEIVAMFTSGEYEMAPARGHVLGTMCEMGLKLAGHLRTLDWTFLFAPYGRQFITSDSPFVIVPPLEHDASLTGVGVLSKGAVKYVALTAKVCLRMDEVGTQIICQQASGSEVRRINCWMALGSERFVYGGSEPLLQRVIDAAKLKPGEHRKEVIVREIPHATDPSLALLQVFSRPKIKADESD